jgi:hypothetical protein
LFRFIPRILIREHPDLFQRLSVCLRAVEKHAHRREVIRDVELGVGQLRHPGAVSQRPVDFELDTNHVLDAHDPAAPHADRLSDIAHILADARTRNLIGRKAVVILSKHPVVALRRIPVCWTHWCLVCGSRRRTSTPLRDQASGSEENGN